MKSDFFSMKKEKGDPDVHMMMMDGITICQQNKNRSCENILGKSLIVERETRKRVIYLGSKGHIIFTPTNLCVLLLIVMCSFE